MAITQSQALSVLSLQRMRSELRIAGPPFRGTPPTDPVELAEFELQIERDAAFAAEHDEFLTAQIWSAVSHVSRASGRTEVADLIPLASAAVGVCRDLYNGEQEIRPTAAGEHLHERVPFVQVGRY